jgi:hypothetical protein
VKADFPIPFEAGDLRDVVIEAEIVKQLCRRRLPPIIVPLPAKQREAGFTPSNTVQPQTKPTTPPAPIIKAHFQELSRRSARARTLCMKELKQKLLNEQAAYKRSYLYDSFGE